MKTFNRSLCRHALTWILAGTSLLLVAACSGDEGPGGDWTFDSGVPRDGGEDVRRDTASDTNLPPQPAETTVWLKNDTSRTLYVQKTADCEASPPAWINWQSNGRPVDTCERCNCSRIVNGEGCTACPEACVADQVEAVDPGERVEWNWSGLRWVDDYRNDCERPRVPGTGEQIQLDVCWGDSWDSHAGGNDVGQVEDPTCEEIQFEYGTTEAGHTVQDDEADEGPPTFELENQTGQAIRVLTPSDCGSDLREWISVRSEGNRLKVRSSCAECQCSSVNDSGQCIACGKACEQRQVKTLAAGETRTYEWNGVGWLDSERNGTQCVERVEASAGDALKARFCWTYETDGDFGFSDRFCEDVDFVLGQVATVSYTIQ